VAKLYINAEDIAAANLGFQLFQVLTDVLIKKGVVANRDILPVLKDLIRFYEAPARNPHRTAIQSSAAKVLRAIATKYEVPPSTQQH